MAFNSANTFKSLFPLYKHTYANTYNIPEGMPFSMGEPHSQNPNMVRMPGMPNIKPDKIKQSGFDRFKRVREIINAKKQF